MEIAPRTTMIAASSTPNTGATGLTVPAPSAPSQPPASCRNFSALAEALEPIAVLSQSVELIRICAHAGAAKEKIPAIGRYTKAERIAWLTSAFMIAPTTESSSIGRAKMTAIASMMRYWATNQPAVSTFGEVLPLISLPTLSRNHWPAWATALVKLRRALSPAVATTPAVAAVTAPPTAPAGALPAWQTLRSTGLEMLSQLCFLAAALPGGCWPGACCANAAGAVNRSRARTPANASSQRPRARLRSRSIVVLLELPGLLEERVGRRGDVVAGGQRRGRGPAADADLLPVRAHPFELDHGHARRLFHRLAGGRAGQAGGPDGDAGVVLVVALDLLAERRGDHHRLVGAGRTVGQVQALADHLGGLGTGRGQHGDRLVPACLVEQELAAEHHGVVGGGGDRALLRVRPALPDAGDHPGRTGGGADRDDGGVHAGRRALRRGAGLGRGGRLRRAA